MTDASDVVGDLHLGTVVINVQDMRRAVDFWTAALGYVPREGKWNPEFIMLVDPAGHELPVSLQLAGSPPKEPVRVSARRECPAAGRVVARRGTA